MITLQRPITDQEVETYREDGVVRLRALFDRHWVKRLRKLAEEMLTAEIRHPQQSQDLVGEGDPGRFFNEMFIWPRVDGFSRVVFEFPAAAIAGALMGSSKINIPMASSVPAAEMHASIKSDAIPPSRGMRSGMAPRSGVGCSRNVIGAAQRGTPWGCPG